MFFVATLTVIGCLALIVAAKAGERRWWRVWAFSAITAGVCFSIALVADTATIADSLFYSGHPLNPTTIAAAAIGAVGLWQTWVAAGRFDREFPKGDYGKVEISPSQQN